MGPIQKLGDFMIFGTDGIRGEICKSPNSNEKALNLLTQERKLCSRFMKLIGLALGRVSGGGSKVIVGWDDRPSNAELVDALTNGLQERGCDIIHAGLCATPALQNALLETDSDFGCMITASHNPVSDSGIKVFDSNGYKTYPDFENEICDIILEMINQNENNHNPKSDQRPSPVKFFDANSAHQTLLNKRFQEFVKLFAYPKPTDILIDCSKGAAYQWLSTFLGKIGIRAKEVSKNAKALNHNCGAGELKPTDRWTWEEAEEDSHILINSLKRTAPGIIIAAALDGDGDRCLLIESTSDGCRVVDGDEMASHILRSASGEWHLAASIESDLSLKSSLDKLSCNVSFTETAVGDRWLAYALKDKTAQVVGVEDSGHLVLSAPTANGARTLVGDGVASLLAVLCAISCEERSAALPKGFKKRITIAPSIRSRWTGKNDLADKVEEIANYGISGIHRSSIEGEPNLMLLESPGISIGVRNSGTQAKTNISLRVAPGKNKSIAERVVDKISVLLKGELLD